MWKLRILRLGYTGADFDVHEWLRIFLESCILDVNNLEKVTFDLPRAETISADAWRAVDRLLVEAKSLAKAHISINIVNGRPSVQLLRHLKENLPLTSERAKVSFYGNYVRLLTSETADSNLDA